MRIALGNFRLLWGEREMRSKVLGAYISKELCDYGNNAVQWIPYPPHTKNEPDASASGDFFVRKRVGWEESERYTRTEQSEVACRSRRGDLKNNELASPKGLIQNIRLAHFFIKYIFGNTLVVRANEIIVSSKNETIIHEGDRIPYPPHNQTYSAYAGYFWLLKDWIMGRIRKAEENKLGACFLSRGRAFRESLRGFFDFHIYQW